MAKVRFTWDADALLEGNGVVVLAGVNLLGNTTVCTVSADHHVNLKGLWGADLAAVSVSVVVDGDGAVSDCRQHS